MPDKGRANRLDGAFNEFSDGYKDHMKYLFSLIFILLLSLTAPADAQQKLGRVKSELNLSALQPGGQGVIAVTLTVPDAHHAQSHTPKGDGMIACEVKMSGSPGIRYLDPVYPTGRDHTDKLLGELNVYEDDTTIYVPFMVDADAKVSEIELTGKITYQICNEEGMCFAPESPAISLKTRIVDAATQVQPTNAALFKGFDPRVFAQPPTTQSADAMSVTTQPATAASPATTQSAVASTGAPEFRLFGYQIVLKSIWIVIPIALLVGLLFNVMPCVLPVLPLKALGFYEASQHNRARTLMFGAMFSLGLILIFTSLAMFAILSKSIIGYEFQFGRWFSIPWVAWGMTLVLIALGMGMLDLFAVNLPNGVYGLSFRHDTIGGNLMWGAMTAILSTPCTAPIFASLLIWAVAQPVYLATIGMIAVGVGMALPYFILSAFPELARRFPRTGPVSELVKQSMAFLLFGTAAWLIGPRIVGEPNQYWLVVAVAAWASLFLIVRGSSIFKSTGGVLGLSAVVVCVLSLSVLLALSMAGVFDKKTSQLATGNASTGWSSDWTKFSDDAFNNAKASGKPVLVKFTASWCLNCKLIERTVFADSKAFDALRAKDVILMKADLTDNDAPGWNLLNKLGQSGIPLTAVYPPRSESPKTMSSIYTTSDLIELLERLGKP